jgi:hypothetical protein
VFSFRIFLRNYVKEQKYTILIYGEEKKKSRGNYSNSE